MQPDAVVLRGDARRLPLPDASVDLICCSPPYFGLRSYVDTVKCYECIQMEYAGRDPRQAWPDYAAHVREVHLRHYDGQIGSEASPAEWVAALVACTAEWVRVLKPSGSIFVNLGDKYNSAQSNHNLTGATARPHGGQKTYNPDWRGSVSPAAPVKSLLGLPWRYALACMDELGLILRRDIIWCLSGGARVYARTPTGDRPLMLRDIARAYRPEDVQLWNGQRWTQVLGWNRSPDRDGALELELRTGERIGCTPGHRWPTQRGVIRADEIRIGDTIQTVRIPEPEQPTTPAGLDDDDIGWLVGLYVAEGSCCERTLQFAGHVREDARHARLSRIAAAYHGNYAVYPTSENGVTCNLNGAVLVGIIDHYVGLGRDAKTKRLRKSVWQRSNRFLAALVDGYLSGDGHFDAKNDRWRLGFTDNDEWATDLRTLAARLGAKISLRRAVHQMGDRSFPGWRGEWRWTRSAYHTAKQDGEVVAIRASRAREFYDIGVADEPHLFALASGVLTHNSKPNGLPESVTDRCRSSHEYLFHFTVRPRYYAAVDEIREPHSPLTVMRSRSGRTSSGAVGTEQSQNRSVPFAAYDTNPLGKLPGSVWDIPSQPLTVPAHLGVDHFAAFPMELPRRVILGWSPPGVCTVCGEGRRPISGYDQEPAYRNVEDKRISEAVTVQWCSLFADWCEAHGVTRRALDAAAGTSDMGGWWASRLPHRCAVPTPEQYALLAARWPEMPAHPGDELWEPFTRRVAWAFRDSDKRDADAVLGRHRTNPVPLKVGKAITGYACACPDATAPVRPAVVVDPFGGTGTTALVASMLGRTGVSVDLSADYCRLARWRTADPAERAKALQVPKPPPVPSGQGSLFDGMEAV